ncbi:MAG: siroheme synthase [Candidatus Rokuibacteriota bacterium]|nr:MAG: siroheme synthase [Candidatus Rokubacteria bacterium]
MPDYFPAFLDLRERPCLVVGGGAIAERKARELLACHARVTVVSPCLALGLQKLAESGSIAWRPRTFLRSDVRRCTLAIAATGVPAVDAAVAVEARRRGVLVNVVDRPVQCDFIFGSVLRRGELQVAVSTGGRSPALAREIRRRLESIIGPEYAELVERVGHARTRARQTAPTPADRLAAGETVVALALDGARSLASGGME